MSDITTTSGRLLGVDHGKVRIGLAVCDGLGIVARPLLIWRRRSRAEDFARFREIIAAEALVGAVVGLPGGDAQSEHPAATSVRNWAKRFALACELPVLLWDETLTSVEAQSFARRGKKRAPIDDWAAQRILQSYLDAHRVNMAPPLPKRPGVLGR